MSEDVLTFAPGTRVRITAGGWIERDAVIFDASESYLFDRIWPGEVAIRLKSREYEAGDFHIIGIEHLVRPAWLPRTVDEVIAWLLQ